MSETIPDDPTEEALKMAVGIIEAEFGLCPDHDFTVGCTGCLASHLVRIIRDEPTPCADKAFAEMQDYLHMRGYGEEE